MDATRCITVLNLVRSMTPIGMPFIYSEYRRSKRMDREFHEVYMKMALKEAEKAGARGEVPVGAILLKGYQVLAKDHNRCIELSDPTAHAEILVLRKGGEILRNYRLNGTVMYVTAEPCPMCVSAMVHGRISRLVFGSCEPKFGAVESKFKLLSGKGLNHKVKVQRGILEKECGEILKVFFRERRSNITKVRSREFGVRDAK
jgi:tRNA(Arg) A34 adenosine deaminase TadA